MTNEPYVTVDRVRRIRAWVPRLAATIVVSSVEVCKGRGWGTPRAQIEGPAPGAFTVSAGDVDALHEGLAFAFSVFEKEFGAL